MWSTPEFKVGVLVVVVAGLIGAMSLKVAEGPGVLTGQRSHYFDVDDAGGLVKNSAVKMAGIKVGVIDDIELVNGKARVHLKLDRDIPVTASSYVELRADGILGDKHVELLPGKPGEKPLESGEPISRAEDRGSLDQMVNEISKITSSLRDLAKNLNQATSGEGDPSTPIGRIVLNIERLTKDLSEMSGRNKDKINEIVDQVHSITSNLDGFISDESPTGFKAAWQKATDSLSRIDSSLKNIDEITGKINRGEGTIGRLVNDESTIDGINQAVENVNEFLGGAQQMETSIDFHSEFLADASAAKSYLNIKIQPGLDRYYELGVVDDPKGVTSVVDREHEQNGTVTESTDTKTYRNKIKFTALFAKNFYNLTIKGGIMESSGGIGVDYHFFKRRLRFSLEAFDLDDPYVRAFARYTVMRGIYLVGGGDNILNRDDEYSTFVGGGIFLTNDDLKWFASKFAF